MGTTVCNIAIKTTEVKPLLPLVKEISPEAYIAQPVNSWVQIFPDDYDEEIAKQLSAKFKTVGLFSQVYNSDDLVIKIYDRGELVFDYFLDMTGGSMVNFKKGDSSVFVKYGLTDREEIVEKIKQTLDEPFMEEYILAEERLRDLCKFLGIAPALGCVGYETIEFAQDQEKETLEADYPGLVKIG